MHNCRDGSGKQQLSALLLECSALFRKSCLFIMCAASTGLASACLRGATVQCLFSWVGTHYTSSIKTCVFQYWYGVCMVCSCDVVNVLHLGNRVALLLHLPAAPIINAKAQQPCSMVALVLTTARQEVSSIGSSHGSHFNSVVMQGWVP